MSDELECFRKAAELGCLDFKTRKNGTILPSPTPRWNRYAAAVARSFWWDRGLGEITPDEFALCSRMYNAAKAFGVKYGESK